MEGFSQEYYNEHNIEVDKLIPRLQVKFKGDNICLKGKKMACSDFTNVIRRDGKYIPFAVMKGEPKKDDIVLDFACLFNVGVAELLSCISAGGVDSNRSFLYACQECEVATDWFDMCNRLLELHDVDIEKDEKFITLAESLRSSLIDSRFPIIRATYSTLQALWWLSPKSYCIALTEAIKYLYPTIAFLDDRYSVSLVIGGEEANNAIKDVITGNLMRCGAVKYMSPTSNKERAISDGRGLGINALFMFMHDIMQSYGDMTRLCRDAFRGDDKSRKLAEERFNSCLGDDYVGRTLTKGHCRLFKCSEHAFNRALDGGLFPADCQHEVEGETPRGILEAEKLWAYAVGLEHGTTTGQYPPIDCTYGLREDYINASMGFVFSERGMSMTKRYESNSDYALMQFALDKLGAESVVRKAIAEYRTNEQNACIEHAKELEDELKKKDELIESLQKRIQDNDRVVLEKTDIISKLREENVSLKFKINSTYMDEDEDDEVVCEDDSEACPSVKEMLEFVNQFKLVLVGCSDTMCEGLELLGFKNVSYLTSERASRGTLMSGDFFCLCTKFLSHKLVYMVEKHYSNQLDQFFYFNGSNAVKFLMSCYDFIHSWFASSTDGDATAFADAVKSEN